MKEVACGGSSKTMTTQSTPSTTRPAGDNQLIESAKATAARVLETIRKKNGDYAAVGDPYRNFQASELLGLSVEQAILVRTLDKVVRISNLLEHESFVAEEPLEDSIDDVIGYMFLLRGWRESINQGE